MSVKLFVNSILLC